MPVHPSLGDMEMTLLWSWDCWSLTALLDGWTWGLVSLLCVQHRIFPLTSWSSQPCGYSLPTFPSNTVKKKEKGKIQRNKTCFCTERVWDNVFGFTLPESKETQNPVHQDFSSCLMNALFYLWYKHLVGWWLETYFIWQLSKKNLRGSLRP